MVYRGLAHDALESRLQIRYFNGGNAAAGKLAFPYPPHTGQVSCNRDRELFAAAVITHYIEVAIAHGRSVGGIGGGKAGQGKYQLVAGVLAPALLLQQGAGIVAADTGYIALEGGIARPDLRPITFEVSDRGSGSAQGNAVLDCQVTFNAPVGVARFQAFIFTVGQ